MPSNSVSHRGVVTKVTDGELEVRILSKSACAACHIKSACNIAEMQEKIVILPKPEDSDFKDGDEVEINMTVAQGNKAVLFAYLIPAVLVIAMIFILNAINLEQGLNALISIGILVPYYFVVYLFRNKLKEKFQYRIEHVSD
ncbi:MAG: SoxR reducing system RseC family protein [Bacteroidales bacterium]|nr:SoxR reducing system RseC family protein [Bacteroidales bacterium]